MTDTDPGFMATLATHAAKDSPAVPLVFRDPLPYLSWDVAHLMRLIAEAEEAAGYAGPSASALLYDRLVAARGEGAATSLWRAACAEIDAKAQADEDAAKEAEAAAIRYRVEENVGGEWMHFGPTGWMTVEQAEESAGMQRAVFPGRAFRIVDDADNRVVREYFPEVAPPSGSQRAGSGWKREYYKVDKTSTGKYSISCEVQVLDGSRFASDEEQDAYVARRLAALNAVCRNEVARQEDEDDQPPLLPRPIPHEPEMSGPHK